MKDSIVEIEDFSKTLIKGMQCIMRLWQVKSNVELWNTANLKPWLNHAREQKAYQYILPTETWQRYLLNALRYSSEQNFKQAQESVLNAITYSKFATNTDIVKDLTKFYEALKVKTREDTWSR